MIKQKNKVAFSDVTKVFFISEVGNNGALDVSKLWYDDFELLQIRRHAKTCLIRSRLGLQDCDDYSSRGLEKLMSIEEEQQCKINRDCVLYGVLTEQKAQNSKLKNSPSEIAKLSHFHSRWAVNEARKIAKLDECRKHETTEEMFSSSLHHI